MLEHAIESVPGTPVSAVQGRCSKTAVALLATLALTALADLCFYEGPPYQAPAYTLWHYVLFTTTVPAWTTALYGGAFLACLGVVRGRAFAGWAGRATALACVALMAAMVLGGGFLPWLLLLLACLTLAMQSTRWHEGAVAWAEQAAFLVCRMFTLPFRDLAGYLRNRPAQENERRLPRFLRNWVFPVVLGLVFLGLFLLANPVLAQWMRDKVWDVLQEVFSPRRWSLWLLAALFAWTALRPARADRDLAKDGDKAGAVPRGLGAPGSLPVLGDFMTPASMTRALVLFNLLFLVQTGMDAVYLLGAGTLPERFTYAEYAHRGAYPLVATALLAGAVVLVALRPGSATARSRTVRALTCAWIAQNVFLVVTSAWRLALYVDAYCLTRLRVGAMIWMFLVALGLVFLVARVALGWSSARLLNANALALAGVLLVVSFVNVDGMIADHNVDHCREMGGNGTPVDLDYMQVLGFEALPALHRLNQAQVLPRAKADRAQGMEWRLAGELHQCLAHWRNWTLRRSLLARDHGGLALRAPALPRDSGWSIEP